MGRASRAQQTPRVDTKMPCPMGNEQDIMRNTRSCTNNTSRTLWRLGAGQNQPPRISAVDVVEAITGKTKNNARNSLDCVRERYPEVARNLSYFHFPGRGQRDTHVLDEGYRGDRNAPARAARSKSCEFDSHPARELPRAAESGYKATPSGLVPATKQLRAGCGDDDMVMMI